ncbi:hypothetical protein J7E88_07825 [Streptomyces sp. ISL-10]|uniref:hypothetical protein n=1 Tax=Streptomyces sp. ISL-10 TaxID=2819172 RepID=UPI001BE54443|nr:hypothetical protein [Streptomyces sp. ISL-10]MBT2365230.1 hypothetical protein [Streptomyces sp. ISL-10]
MWQVTAKGNEGRTYVYEVDAPDYAPEGEVFASACRQHGQERRTRNITETLDIRTGAYSVRMLYPQGQRDQLDKIIAKVTEAGLTLTAEDLDWVDGEPRIQGMDPAEWLSGMTAD